MGEKRYTPRGFTWKHCHGCGQEVLHMLGAVCNECESKIKAADAITAREHAREDVQEFRIPRQAYNMPHYTTVGGTNKSYWKKGKLLEEAFYRVLLLFVQEPDAAWRSAHSIVHDGSVNWYQRMVFPHPRGSIEDMRNALLPPNVIEPLRDLDATILALTEQAYVDGVQEGTRILDRLASGQITVAEFNKLSMGE